MLKLGSLRKTKGATKATKRLGRGSGSGQGGTAGKGDKGQLARSGGVSRRGFEGGQMPLYRRVPKRGFTSLNTKVFEVVNLDDLQTLGLKKVDPSILVENGLVRRSGMDRVKLLARGEVKLAIEVSVHSASESAVEKIKKAGGDVQILKGSQV